MNIAGTMLNICAILSQMGKHELALHHAMKALLLIQDELLARTETVSPGSAPSQADAGNDDRFTVMVIALHNIAVEHEYLKQFQQSLTHYKKAKDFAGMNSEIELVDGVAMVTRGPLDRLQQICAQSWFWIGGFVAPTDATANSTIIPTAGAQYLKRAVVIEHV
jgi:tetratricopeptide (TPR) repeat protein